MRRKIAMKRQYMFGIGILWAILCVVVIFVVKNNYFVGITMDDIEYISQVTPTEYTVHTIRQNTQADGTMSYKVTFVDEMNIAPEFSVDFNTLPADFALGNIYTAQWLQVVGTVDGYTRSKDMISIQFAEQTLDNTAITQLRSDVCVALSDILDKRLNVLFYPFCIISFLVVIVGELAVIRISGVLTEKYFKPTEWDYLQESIDARTASKVRNTLDFTDELAVLHTMAMRFTKRTRQTNVQTQQLATYKDSVAKKEHDMSTQDIVLKQSGFEQTKKKAMQRPAKKIKPIQEDILLDSSLLAKKRL